MRPAKRCFFLTQDAENLVKHFFGEEQIAEGIGFGIGLSGFFDGFGFSVGSVNDVADDIVFFLP